MASIIPNESPALDFNMDPPPQSHYKGFEDAPINSVARSPTVSIEGPATYVSSAESTVEQIDTNCTNGLSAPTGESTVSVKQEGVNGESQSSPYSSHKQSTESDLTRGTETYASSPAAASSYPPQPNQSHHHAHPGYPQYYQHYPHGHTPYYYPPGPYYPPPPAHGGHQPYASTGHHPHYYAHYPPPPGYYPPPNYSHYYGQHPPAASSPAESTHTNNSVQVSTSPSTVASTKKSSVSNSPTSTSSSSTKSTKGPYSAFSSSKNSPPKTIGLSSTYKSAQKPKPSLSSTKNKRKQPPVPDSNAIFRLNAKRSKQLAANSKAAAAAIAAKRAESKVKAQSELSKTVLERRSRKNAQSRMRASKLKQRIADVQKKNPEDRTPEEVGILSVFEERRQRKNGRSRERAMERKKEYDRISSIPEHLWSSREKSFVQETVVAKFKKNEGDRMRRKKLKGDNDESYGSCSLSGDWDSSTCRSSTSKKLPYISKKSSDQSGIPDYIESTNDIMDTGYTSESAKQSSFFPTKDAPLTPLSQKEAYSLLESTPTNFFGTATPDRKSYFSPNLIFPSPSINRRDMSANMDSIDFDSLVLPTDGTSILDSSMAIDDEVIYSPHLNPSTINVSESAHHGFQTTAQHAIPQLSSSSRLSPLNLPRRNRPSENIMKLETINHPCPETESYEFPYSSCGDDTSGDHSHVASKSIAVSFSVDTA